MPGYTTKNFESKMPVAMLSSYYSEVRPHFKYIEKFWSLNHRKDVKLLEKVQRRATKTIPPLRAQTYKVRLKRPNIFSFKRDDHERYDSCLKVPEIQ